MNRVRRRTKSTMTEFTRRTVDYLNQSGWTPHRVVDTTAFETSLNAAGFVVHDAALDFLKEYGGLRIQYRHAKVPDMQDEMHFDPVIVVTHIQSSAVNAYSGVGRAKLWPIGKALGESGLL